MPPVAATSWSRDALVDPGPRWAASSSSAPAPVTPPTDRVGQVGGVELAGITVSGSEDERDPLVLQPPCGEQQRGSRRLVEPVRVVHDDQDRRLRCGLGQHGQCAEVDQETLALPRGRAHCSAQRVALRLGKSCEPVVERPEQPLQRSERQRRLGLHTRRAQHPEAVRTLDRICQERRLADAGDAVHDQGTAMPCSSSVDQCRDRRALGIPPGQHAPDGTCQRRCRPAIPANPPG